MFSYMLSFDAIDLLDEHEPLWLDLLHLRDGLNVD